MPEAEATPSSPLDPALHSEEVPTPPRARHTAVHEDPAFEAVLQRIEGVDGWMTDDQAHWLWDLSTEVPARGRIVEIGSYRGRSAIVLATAAAESVEVVAIDPHGGGDRGPQQITGLPEEGQEDHERFLENLDAAGVRDRVRHVRLPSSDAYGDVDEPVDFLYIDGAHRFGPARADIVGWGARVRPGGSMAIHDSFSSVGVTLALLTSLFFGGQYRYTGRTTSLATYRREHLGVGARLANAGRQIAQLPWFARNVLIKVLIAAHLHRAVRALGHDPDVWPY